MVGSSTSDGTALLWAAQWVDATIQGPLATGIAILAMAALGFAMLSGRIPLRRGATAVLGCFVLFGAPAIAHGIASMAGDYADTRPPALAATIESGAPVFEVPINPERPVVSDPYAGASIAR